MKFLKWKIIAPNAGNAICGNLDFKMFRRACPRNPLESLALRARRLGYHDLFFKASFANEHINYVELLTNNTNNI